MPLTHWIWFKSGITYINSCCKQKISRNKYFGKWDKNQSNFQRSRELDIYIPKIPSWDVLGTLVNTQQVKVYNFSEFIPYSGTWSSERRVGSASAWGSRTSRGWYFRLTNRELTYAKCDGNEAPGCLGSRGNCGLLLPRFSPHTPHLPHLPHISINSS